MSAQSDLDDAIRAYYDVDEKDDPQRGPLMGYVLVAAHMYFGPNGEEKTAYRAEYMAGSMPLDRVIGLLEIQLIRLRAQIADSWVSDD